MGPVRLVFLSFTFPLFSENVRTLVLISCSNFLRLFVVCSVTTGINIPCHNVLSFISPLRTSNVVYSNCWSDTMYHIALNMKIGVIGFNIWIRYTQNWYHWIFVNVMRIRVRIGLQCHWHWKLTYIYSECTFIKKRGFVTFFEVKF